MQLKLWAGLVVLISILVTGCQRKTDTVPTPPQPLPVSQDLRERIHRLSPSAVIGRIIAVLPADHLVSVGDVPVQDFHKGDIVTIMGGEETPIANGSVIAVVRDTIQVCYDQPPAGQRIPAIGDLAIRFSK